MAGAMQRNVREDPSVDISPKRKRGPILRGPILADASGWY